MDNGIEVASNPSGFESSPLPEYRFYNGEIIVYYDDDAHSYTRIGADGLVLIPGVTTVCHIIDKSAALTQWAANKCAEYAMGKYTEMTDDIFNMVIGTRESFQEWLAGLLEEARFHFRDIKEQAGDIGKMAHSCIEVSIKKAIRETQGIVRELVDIPEHPQAESCVMAAFKWMQTHNVRWISTERKIYSRKYDYAGTEDGKALVDSCDDLNCCGMNVFKDLLCVIDWKSSNRLYDEYRYQTAAYEAAEEEELGIDIKARFILRLGKEDGEFEPWFLDESEFELDFKTFLHCLDLYNSIQQRKQIDKQRKAEVKAAIKVAKDAAKDEEKRLKAEAKAQAKADKEAAKQAEKDAKAAAKAEAKAAKEQAVGV